jgi:hypothetical protein
MKPKELTIRGHPGALINDPPRTSTSASRSTDVIVGSRGGDLMAILSAVKDSSILENNIVQTVASAVNAWRSSSCPAW